MTRRPLTPAEQVRAENLRRLWDAKKAALGLTQEKAARLLGYKTQAAVGHYLTRRNPLNTDALLKFAQLLQVGPDEIDPGFRFGLPDPAGFVRPQPVTNPSVPLISWVQAGEWLTRQKTQRVLTDYEWVVAPAFVSEQAFALRVVGDSMTNPSGLPTIPPGSIVVVDPGSAATNGKIVVTKLNGNGETTLKKLIIEPPHKMLVPLNPLFPSIELKEGDEIVGVVRKIEYPL